MSQKVRCPWCGRNIYLGTLGTDLAGRSVLQGHFRAVQDPNQAEQECEGSHRSPEAYIPVPAPQEPQ